MKNTASKICVVSMMASMVLVATFIRIPIPMGGMRTMIHLGNAACILSGLLLGPVHGGLAAALGSFTFDLLAPGYIVSAPFTLVFKFIMGAVCGTVAHTSKKPNRKLIAAILGTMCYIVLNATKNFFKNMYLLGIPIQANIIILGKGIIVPIINAALAVMIAVPLARLLENVIPLSVDYSSPKPPRQNPF